MVGEVHSVLSSDLSLGNSCIFLTTFPSVFVLDSNYGAEALGRCLVLSPEVVPVVGLSLATERISFKALQS